ncbi:MAG: hypothetical protein IKJ88_00915 [Clostridia bacterium]|nr:hypothetical protein [Clostridia bacterium]
MAKKKVKDIKETVFIPKEAKGDDSLYVAVNGKRILVKKGEAVSLPKEFAEVVNNSLKQKTAADAYIESTAK